MVALLNSKPLVIATTSAACLLSSTSRTEPATGTERELWPPRTPVSAPSPPPPPSGNEPGTGADGPINGSARRLSRLKNYPAHTVTVCGLHPLCPALLFTPRLGLTPRPAKPWLVPSSCRAHLASPRIRWQEK